MNYIKLTLAGLLISFLGTLPIGTLNSTAFYIAASQSVVDALWYAIAVVLVELLVVRVTLASDKKINFDGKLAFYLIPIGAILLFYLAIYSFISASNADAGFGSGTSLFPGIESPFLLGILLSALNPMHIPFWMGWNRFLISKNLLDNTVKSTTLYIIGIGVGSIAGLIIFIFAGYKIVENFAQYNSVINLVLGLLYLGFACYLVFLLYKKHLKLKIQ